MKRALGALIVGGLLVEGLIACGGNPQDSQIVAVVDTPMAVKSANVTIGLLDSNGVRQGTCSGVLLGPRLVLTAGHCIAGKTSWSILSAEGSRANGLRGFTADWLNFESDAAHPGRHDFGVIQLDKDITLLSYPKLATAEAASAADLVRIRNLGGSQFEARTAFANPIDGYPHAYATGMMSDEALDTGGAVLDESGDVVGVISGRGTTTGNLYVARVDTHFVWLYSKVDCSTPTDDGSDDTSSAGEIGIQCHPTSDGGNSNGGTGCTKDAGGGDDGGTSGGDSSGGDSGGSTCQSSGGNCSGTCPSGSGSSVTGSDGSTTDTNGSTSGGSSGSSGSGSGSSTGSNSGGSSSGGSGGSSGSDNGGSGSSTGSSGGSNSGGSSGSSGSGSSTGSNTGSNSGSNSGSGSSTGSNSGSSVGNNSTSGGSTGSTSAVGSSIPRSVIIDSCENGGCPDDTIDYGDCGCTNSGSGTNNVK